MEFLFIQVFMAFAILFVLIYFSFKLFFYTRHLWQSYKFDNEIRENIRKKYKGSK